MDIRFCAIFLVIAVCHVFGLEDLSTKTTPELSKEKICSVCKCEDKEKTLSCNNLNLNRLFSDESWNATNETNYDALINVRFDTNGLEIVTQFPVLDIRSLNFHNNKIQKIDKAAFKNLKFLEKLDLSSNKLTFAELKPNVFEGKYAPETYEPLANLKVLNLAHNLLHSLDSDMFEHLPNLEVLSLSYNPFKVIDQHSVMAISSVVSLTVLDMSYMELKDLPDTIFHTPQHLKSLNLTGNLFKTIPEAIQHGLNLVDLVIDDNVLEYIGGNGSVFPKLPKLESLSISYTKTLVKIGEGAFHQLAALQHFTCRNNPLLTTIHMHAFAKPGKESTTREEWPPIRSLNLYENNLTMIEPELLGRWDEIEKIDIRSNPWRCDCKNQWMVDTLMPIIKEKSPTTTNDIKCDHPVEMAGKSFLDMFTKGSQMRCDDYYRRRPERDGPILVGVLIGLLIGIPVSLGLILAYKRGCFGILGYQPNPNEYARAFYKRAGVQEDLQI